MIRNEDPYALRKTNFSKDVSLLPSLRSVLRFLTLRIPSLDISLAGKDAEGSENEL